MQYRNVKVVRLIS